MVSKGIAALFLSLAVAPATAAEGPFDGDWYWICDGPEEFRGKTVISDGKILVDQIDCTILQIEKVGGEGQVWKTRNSCIEDGETWVEEVIFGMEQDVDGNVVQLIEISMTDGYVLSYRRCD